MARYLAALIPTGAALAIQFATFAITARGLGVAQFGQYAAIVGIAAIMTEIVGLGTADLLVRAVARDTSRFRAQLGNMVIVVGATLIPVTLIGLAIAFGPVGTKLPIAGACAGLLGEILAARSAASAESIMIAHGDTFHASCVRVGSGATRLVAALAFFAFARSLDAWVWAVLAQSVFLTTVLFVLVTRKYGTPLLSWHRQDTLTGATFALNQTSRATQGNVDRLILAWFTTDVIVGTYAAGSRLLVVGLFPIQVLTRILYPQFFRHGERGIKAARSFALKSIPAMLATGIFSFVAVVAVAQLLPALLGADFAPSRHTAILLALAMPLIGLQYLGADTLTGSGHQAIRAIISVVATFGFGLTMALGAHLAGVNGVIVAFLSSHLVFTLTMWTFALTVRDKSVVATVPVA